MVWNQKEKALAIKVLWVYAALFAIGATLIVAGNLARKVEPEGRKQMWVKYLTYLVITGSVLGSAFLHPLVFSLLAAFVLAVCVYEFLLVMQGMVRVGTALGAAISLAAIWGERPFLFAVAASIVVLLLIPLFRREYKGALSSVLPTIAGICYVSFLGSHIILLGGQENFFGHITFFYMLVLVNDAMALLWGRLLGKRQIWPVLSPNKTYGGSVGALVWTLLVGYLMRFAEPQWGLFPVLFASLLIAVFGQLGDVVASAFKRVADVKDFGDRLPTFGGMLDRFDAFVFTAPVYYYFVVLTSLP
jgi:phosphatidate cytidylyltransferase